MNNIRFVPEIYINAVINILHKEFVTIEELNTVLTKLQTEFKNNNINSYFDHSQNMCNASRLMGYGIETIYADGTKNSILGYKNSQDFSTHFRWAACLPIDHIVIFRNVEKALHSQTTKPIKLNKIKSQEIGFLFFSFSFNYKLSFARLILFLLLWLCS